MDWIRKFGLVEHGFVTHGNNIKLCVQIITSLIFAEISITPLMLEPKSPEGNVSNTVKSQAFLFLGELIRRLVKTMPNNAQCPTMSDTVWERVE